MVDSRAWLRAVELDFHPAKGQIVNIEDPHVNRRVRAQVPAHHQDEGIEELHTKAVALGRFLALDWHADSFPDLVVGVAFEQVELVVYQLSIALRAPEDDHLVLVKLGGPVRSPLGRLVLAVLRLQLFPRVLSAVVGEEVVGDAVDVVSDGPPEENDPVL